MSTIVDIRRLKVNVCNLTAEFLVMIIIIITIIIIIITNDNAHYCCCFVRYTDITSWSDCCKWWSSTEGPVLQWISKDWESSNCASFGTILVSVRFARDPRTQQGIDIIKKTSRFYINCESKLNAIYFVLFS